jgi:hypothetical protein
MGDLSSEQSASHESDSDKECAIDDAPHASERRRLYSRKRGTDVPVGWSPVKEGRGRFLWRCPKTMITIDQELRRCSVMVRKSRIQAHIDKRSCKYEIAQRDDPLNPRNEPGAEERKRLRKLSDVQKRIQDNVALLAMMRLWKKGKSPMKRRISDRTSVHC